MDAGNGAEQRNGGKASVSGADPAPLPREAPSDHRQKPASPKPAKVTIQGRRKLFDFPCGVYEIPGRPHMIFKVQDYETAERARREIPFLFQAFEAGQEPPPGMKRSASRKKHSKSRDQQWPQASGTSVGSKRQRVADFGNTGSVSTLNQGDGLLSQGGTVVESLPAGNGTSAAANGAADPTAPAVLPVPCAGAGGASNIRPATIHEYLDWTVTAKCTRPDAEDDAELDFEGFRVVTVCGRHRPQWPRPRDQTLAGGKGATENEKMKLPWMGETLPALSVSGSAYSAATLRSGYGCKDGTEAGRHWIEVPFFATAPTKRGRGFGRCLLDAIQHICQCLDINALHLCSTNDPTTTCIWRKLGFTDDSASVDENLAACGLTLKGPGLLHMDNTVQMYKHVTKFTRKDLRRIRISHQSLVQVLYYKPEGGEGPGAGGGAGGKSEEDQIKEAADPMDVGSE